MPLQPQRNDQGAVIPHNDDALSNESLLIRHINPDYHVVPDENIGGRRIGSNAFSATNGDPHNGMSVNLEQLINERGLEPKSLVPENFGAVSLNVGDVRDLDVDPKLQVGSDPEPHNRYHGQVWGVKGSVRRKLHRLVRGWVVELKDVHLK
jgi:ribosomal protein L21E